jgi:hypothetical protein
MTTSTRNGSIQFEGPGRYRIIVKGLLKESWADRMADMQILCGQPKAAIAKTTLVGHLRDQAQLSGVLNSLYELHMPILLVELVENNQGNFE